MLDELPVSALVCCRYAILLSNVILSTTVLRTREAYLPTFIRHACDVQCHESKSRGHSCASTCQYRSHICASPTLDTLAEATGIDGCCASTHLCSHAWLMPQSSPFIMDQHIHLPSLKRDHVPHPRLVAGSWCRQDDDCSMVEQGGQQDAAGNAAVRGV